MINRISAPSHPWRVRGAKLILPSLTACIFLLLWVSRQLFITHCTWPRPRAPSIGIDTHVATPHRGHYAKSGARLDQCMSRTKSSGMGPCPSSLAATVRQTRLCENSGRSAGKYSATDRKSKSQPVRVRVCRAMIEQSFPQPGA